ncbi:sterol desaturase family protein [Rhodobacteraceae bacterium]|nr:sterol desaturase family protein [Paracoccaceae bacterium]
MEFLTSILASLQGTFFGMSSRLAVLFLAATVVLVLVLWVIRGRPGRFFDYLLPKEVYLHRSNLIDIQIFCVNLVLAVLGVLSAVVFTTLVAAATLTQLIELAGHRPSLPEVTWVRSAAATLIIVLTKDFCKYWAHWFHHESRILWPFHALHHSAEVLTPLTAQRNHPVFLLIRSVIYSLLLGLATGLMLFLLIGEIDLLTIGGANAGYFLFNLFGANLRHSHVWLSYGPVIEHIFISPAQHQIHHSIEKRHFNKNYGEVFAIWDWMFGTLYVPKGYEDLTFGLADAKGRPVEQPHTNLVNALVLPFAESLSEVTGIKFQKRGTSQPSKSASGVDK